MADQQPTVTRYAIVDIATREVVNVTVWTGEGSWSPPQGAEAIESETHNIGDRLD